MVTKPNLDEIAALAPPGYRRPLEQVTPRMEIYKGKKKGTRNMTTLLRQAVLNKQEDIMLKHLPKIVKLACQMAEKGDLQAMKMIMDRMVPVQKPVDSSANGGGGNRAINIIINGTAPPSGVTIQETNLIDNAQYEEIPNE